jgi:glyoxylase-like metal-dependent hydrolase (beta-lactamase superfamily II)
MTKDIDVPRSSYFVGDLEVLVVPDGYRTFALPDGFIVNAAREDINAALAAAGMPPDMMTIVFNPVIVRTGKETILYDTGNGPQPEGATMGRIQESLAVSGIDPASIGRVVISHFHGDHINGLKTASGDLAFPNADILVPEPEWNFWMDDAEMARASTPRMQELFKNVRRVFDGLSERIGKYADGTEIASGIRSMATPGHTHGHMSFMLTSGGKSLFLQSDVTNHPALFVAHPGWHAMFDIIPDLAEKTRRRIYDMLVAEKMPVLGFHHPAPSVSTVEKTPDGYRLNATTSI